MKKTPLVSAGIATLLLLLTLSWKSGPVSSPSAPASGVDSLFPAEIQAILQKSCIGCHSEGGKALAMSKLNFSEWSAYSPAKQTQKIAKICSEVKEGTMPPRAFLKQYPDDALSPDQVRMICEWAAQVKAESGNK